MKIRALCMSAALLLAGFSSAQAEHEGVFRSLTTFNGKLSYTSSSGGSYATMRVTQRDLMWVMLDDMGYELSNREMRSARLVNYSDGYYAGDYFIEYYNTEFNEWWYVDVTDRFDYDIEGDIAGEKYATNSRWCAGIDTSIDLVEGGDLELWGFGVFSSLSREARRFGYEPQFTTNWGFRSVMLPMLLVLDALAPEYAFPLTANMRFNTRLVDWDMYPYWDE